MSAGQHTAGPWVATNKEYGTWATDVRAGSDGQGRRVATTFALNPPSKKRGEALSAYRERYDAQARQNEANARLIAAAPDLLGAVRALLPIARLYLESGDSQTRAVKAHDFAGELNSAVAAIARATGAA